jgi:hypothetical protein
MTSYGKTVAMLLLATVGVAWAELDATLDEKDFLGKWIYTRDPAQRAYVVREGDAVLFRYLSKGVVSQTRPATFAQGTYTIDDVLDYKAWLEEGGTYLVIDGRRYRRLSDSEAKALNEMHERERKLQAEAERLAKVAEADKRAAQKRASEVWSAAGRASKACHNLDRQALLAELTSYPELLQFADYDRLNGGLALAPFSGVSAPPEVRADFIRFVARSGVRLNLRMRIWGEPDSDSGSIPFFGTIAHSFVLAGTGLRSRPAGYFQEDKYDAASAQRDTIYWLDFFTSEGLDLNLVDEHGRTPLDMLDFILNSDLWQGRKRLPDDSKRKAAMSIRNTLIELGARTTEQTHGWPALAKDYSLIQMPGLKAGFSKSSMLGKVTVIGYDGSLYKLKELSEQHSVRGLYALRAQSGWFFQALSTMEEEGGMPKPGRPANNSSAQIPWLWDYNGGFAKTMRANSGDFYFFDRTGKLVATINENEAGRLRTWDDQVAKALTDCGIWSRVEDEPNVRTPEPGPRIITL